MVLTAVMTVRGTTQALARSAPLPSMHQSLWETASFFFFFFTFALDFVLTPQTCKDAAIYQDDSNIIDSLWLFFTLTMPEAARQAL